MTYTKLSADRIFDGFQFLTDQVLIIQENGSIEALVAADAAGDEVRHIDGILTPGFINCHCHLELSHMKSQIEEHTGLLQFVNQVVRRRNEKAGDIPQAIADAEAAMIQNGIVAVGDICNTTDTLPQKEKGELYYHNFVEVIGFEPEQAQQSFDNYKTIYDSYRQVFKARQVSLTPHAPYSVSTPLWELLSGFAQGNLLSIHNQETPDENEWFLKGKGGFKTLYERLQLKQPPITPTGKSSVQSYGGYLNPQQPLLFIHNVHTSPDDIQYVNRRFPNAFWCLCPNANYYISNELPDIPMMIREGAAHVLGTDSLASNYGLSIWSEIQRIQQYYPEIPLEQMLQWATSNGAKALGIQDRFGSFEKGKNPGFVTIKDNVAKKLK